MDPHVMVAMVMCGSASAVAGGMVQEHASLIWWLFAVSKVAECDNFAARFSNTRQVLQAVAFIVCLAD
jgi:hypothetical protein